MAASLTFDEALQTFRPEAHHDGMIAAGAANGTFELGAAIREGHAAGEAAAKAARPKGRQPKVKAPNVSEPSQSPLEAIWFAPAAGTGNEGNKHFVDFQNDVTAADLELAQREGYESVEHTKRYTTLGMATDQGKTSNLNGLGVLSDATGRAIPEIGVTTFRPPYTPLSFGAIAGTHARGLFLPVRRTPVFDWHVEHKADFEPVGMWRRPYCYRKGPRDEARRDQPRDPGGAQPGRSPRCIDAREDRDQGPRRGAVPRPHLHQHVLDAEGGPRPATA